MDPPCRRLNSPSFAAIQGADEDARTRSFIARRGAPCLPGGTDHLIPRPLRAGSLVAVGLKFSGFLLASGALVPLFPDAYQYLLNVSMREFGVACVPHAPAFRFVGFGNRCGRFLHPD